MSRRWNVRWARPRRKITYLCSLATCRPALPTRKAYGHSQILPQPPQWKLGSAGLSLGIGPITECRSSLSRGRESWTFYEETTSRESRQSVGDCLSNARKRSARRGSTGRTSRLHTAALEGEGSRCANPGAYTSRG